MTIIKKYLKKELYYITFLMLVLLSQKREKLLFLKIFMDIN